MKGNQKKQGGLSSKLDSKANSETKSSKENGEGKNSQHVEIRWPKKPDTDWSSWRKLFLTMYYTVKESSKEKKSEKKEKSEGKSKSEKKDEDKKDPG